jgi:hypothetical protein
MRLLLLFPSTPPSLSSVQRQDSAAQTGCLVGRTQRPGEEARRPGGQETSQGRGVGIGYFVSERSAWATPSLPSSLLQ